MHQEQARVANNNSYPFEVRMTVAEAVENVEGIPEGRQLQKARCFRQPPDANGTNPDDKQDAISRRKTILDTWV